MNEENKPKIVAMLSPRSGRPVPNQYIINEGNAQYFQSYQTIIAKREFGKSLVLDAEYWDYSRTTLRYLKEFTGLSRDAIASCIDNGIIVLANLNR